MAAFKNKDNGTWYVQFRYTCLLYTSSLCDMAPVERKMEFDNVGLLAGDAGQEVSRVLLCLDITMQAVEEARQQRCQLIVSHHPLFFSLPKALRCDCYETARVTRLLQYGISAICMHTNLDCAAGGVNDGLLQRLGPVSYTHLAPQNPAQ